MPIRSTLLSWAVLALVAAPPAAANDVPYTDNAAGYALRHPAGWAVSSKKSAHAISTSFVNPATYNHGCVLTAYGSDDEMRKYAGTALLKQEDWLRVLKSDRYEDVRILQAGASTLGGIAANKVEFTAFQNPGGKAKGMFGHFVIHTAASSQRVWHVACSALAPSPEGATPLFEQVRPALSGIPQSVRFLSNGR